MSLSIRLNKRLLLQQKVTGQDAAGQPQEDWRNVILDGDGRVWAEIVDLSARDFLSANADQTRVQTRITIRARPGVTAGMRALHGNVVYGVVSPLERDDGSLLLMCSKEVG